MAYIDYITFLTKKLWADEKERLLWRDDKQKDAFMTVGGQTGMARAAPGRQRLNRLSREELPHNQFLSFALPQFPTSWRHTPSSLNQPGFPR